VNLDLTTFLKPAESKMGLLCISVGPHYTIWCHQWICSLSSAALIHTFWSG